jgi:DNA-binding response OmpR family regulator
MKKIWVVDDEKNIRDLIRRYLTKEDYDVQTFSSAEEFDSAFLAESKPDLIVLDIMLPGTDGLDLCRRLRIDDDIPIIFVSARGEEFDRVLGLELGADDYLAKPFSPRELVVRVKNIFKRLQTSGNTDQVISLKNVTIIPTQRRATINGEETSFTAREFNLLQLMAVSPGRSFSRTLLIEKIWGYDFEGDERAVDDTVKRIRKKLREKGAQPELVTVWGYGYRLDV